MKSNASSTPTPPPVEPLRLTVDEAAAALRCSRVHVFRLLKSGALRGQKDGKRRYLTPAEIRAYVQRLDGQAA